MKPKMMLPNVRTPLRGLQLLLALAIISLTVGLSLHSATYHDFLCGISLGILVAAAFLTFSIDEVTLKEEKHSDDLIRLF